MASEQEELLFGRLALHYKLITPAQLEEVHALQALAGGRRQLPDILVEMSYLTQRQVEQLLVVQRDYLEKKRAQPQRATGSHRALAATAAPGAPALDHGVPAAGSGAALAAAPAAAPAAARLTGDDTVAVGQPPIGTGLAASGGGAAGPAIGPHTGRHLPPLSAFDTRPPRMAGAATGAKTPAGSAGQAGSPAAAAGQAAAAPAPHETAAAVAVAAPHETAGALAAPAAQGAGERGAGEEKAGGAAATPARVAAPTASAWAGATAAAAPWAGGAAGRRQLDAVLALAVERGASDIHIHSGAPIGLRIAGRLVDLDAEPLAPAVAARMIQEILDDQQRAALAHGGQVDFAYALPGRARFRANAYRQQRGHDAVFRTIPSQPPTLLSLGLPESLARLADYHQGMVLITGPSGCGKSSTMAALINIINETRSDHIVTAEDPIEYIHASRRAIVNQRQVGPHTSSFARAMRAALREDPDVIAIGELRDLETIALAITAAETGHLVLATLHTNNAVRTINRVLGVFPPNQQAQMRTMLSASLRAVVSQRLLARADGRGRVVALELLIVTKAVTNLIRENKTFQIRSVLQTGGAHGMVQLDTSLADLVKSGTVTREEALLHAEDPAKFPA